ncbi:MAG: beta-glucosidase [bacterium]|nr:beta-glucosidase [bacterium]
MKYAQFPKDFIFGAASAAFQVEGAWNSDGKGESIWDRFAHTPKKIKNGHSADIACDHYHTYKEDVALMNDLALQAYRFSISWPRVMPQGSGAVNAKGIDFYSRLVDELLEKGITPFATLFHWDLPLALEQDIGGFASRDCAGYFSDYAAIMVQKLGDRVKHWMTLNEPQDYAFNGYLVAEHAPGKLKPWLFLKVIHNQLLAHGKAVQAMKSIDPDCKVGLALNHWPVPPLTDSPNDKKAALLGDQFVTRICMDPLFKAEYPKEIMHKLRWFKPKIMNGDMECISTPVDFVGINNYTRHKAYYKRWIPFLNAWLTESDIADTDFVKDGSQYTSMGWKVSPESIYTVITRLQKEYGNPPMYITENGAAFDDVPVGDKVNDVKRVEFLKSYLAMVKKAVDEGANLKGYFVWSFIDNFEWSLGFDKRFGIVYNDFDSQKRIIKDSGYWYRDLIRAQGVF